MLNITFENRLHFLETIARHDAASTASFVPIGAFVKAALEVHSVSEAELFLAGHLHWIRSKKPRSVEQAMTVAKANLAYCYEEGMPESDIQMWTDLLAQQNEEVVPPPQAPSAFQKLVEKVGELPDVSVLASAKYYKPIIPTPPPAPKSAKVKVSAADLAKKALLRKKAVL